MSTTSIFLYIVLKPAERKRSIQSKYTSSELRAVIRQFVIDENEATRPITAQLVANHVAKVMNKEKKIPARSMRRLLRRMVFFHIRGKHRNYLAERENNVSFRATYLQKKIDNRDENSNPVRPEVYLDESYVNVNHPIELVWGLVKNRIAYDRANNASDIYVKVAAELGKVTGQNWCKFYWHVQKFEDKYLKALDDCPLVSDEEDTSEEADEDCCSEEEEDEEVVVYRF
ncbi:hypothetical protein BBJ28_00016612 [Nothophytophthora sp. Chile5]|nr:hypothetical protein BBJ28_00016612 [Nothophytophthora sp. Chile5]